MAISADTVIVYWKDHREQLRQSETQRSTLTNLLLVITAALSALIIQQKFALTTLPLSIFIVLIGAYGAVAVAKYYERASYHLQQARALTRSLVDAGVLGSDDFLDEARRLHYERFPRLSRVRLNRLWVLLHLGIMLYGSTLLALTAFSSQ